MATLSLQPFQGIPILDMGHVEVGGLKLKALRIIYPESAKQSTTTIEVDPNRPPAAGLGVTLGGSRSIHRGEVCVVDVSWRPDSSEKFRSNLFFRWNGKFLAQVTVVGQAMCSKVSKERKELPPVSSATSSTSSYVLGRGRATPKPAEAKVVGSASGTQEHASAVECRRTCEGGAESGDEQRVAGVGDRATRHMGVEIGATVSSLGGTGVGGKHAGGAGRGGKQHVGRCRKPTAHGAGKATSTLESSHNDTRSIRSAHDSSWVENQMAGLAAWLNFAIMGQGEQGLIQAGDLDGTDVGDAGCEDEKWDENHAAKRDLRASPMKTIITARREARDCSKAQLLFRSGEMRSVSKTIEDKVSLGEISVRKDKVIHADVGLTASLVNLLLSYEPHWLALGIHAVLGEEVPLPPVEQRTSGKLDKALRAFIARRVVKCPTIKSRFKFRGRVASGRVEKEYNLELSRHMVRTVLKLVVFLDRAKAENLLPLIPCLFRKTSEVKTSVEVLRAFCQFLHGQGDFVRYLRKMNYTVTYQQRRIDEFDFSVSDLLVDLRDGVRLTRLVEVITASWGLTSDLRVPAVSRLQKLHNAKLALEKLRKDGVSAASGCSAVTARDVVDGSRDATLRLAWSIVTHYSLSSLLDRSALEREVTEILADVQRRGRSYRAGCFRGCREFASVVGDYRESVAHGIEAPSQGLAAGDPEHPGLPMPDVTGAFSSSRTNGESGAGTGGHGAKDITRALLVWCQVICHSYGVPVTNFTTSFADGRALCLLIHFYYPTLLPLEAIRRTTAHLPRNRGKSGATVTRDFSGMDGGQFEPDLSRVSDAEYQTALNGERTNGNLARHGLEQLGGVPSMLGRMDSRNLPGEKTMVTVIAHLCTRLLESSAENRAAICIQILYRARLRRRGREASKATRESVTIPPSLESSPAPPQTDARGVTGGWDKTCPEEKCYSEKAATRIQAMTRRWLERRAYLDRRASCVTLQAWIRGRLQRRWYLSLLSQIVKAVQIQAFVRGRLARLRAERTREERQIEEGRQREDAARAQYLARVVGRKRVMMAKTIQTVWRGHRARQVMTLDQKSATRIQSVARGFTARVAARRRVMLATWVQAAWRGHRARQVMMLDQESATRIQSVARGFLSRVAARRRVMLATWVQAAWRGHRARQVMMLDQESATRIQSVARGFLSRVSARRRVMLATWVQAAWRGHRARQVMMREQMPARRLNAAVLIQAVVRGLAVRRGTCASVSHARVRLAKAEQRARADPSLKLGARLEDALMSLEHARSLTSIIRACVTLELSTRYSQACCEAIAKSRGPTVVLNLVRSLNRSPPQEKILRYMITILRNIVQRGGNLPALVATPPCFMDVVLDILQKYRERQDVFLPTVRLLHQVVATDKSAKAACNEPRHAQHLKVISNGISRKCAPAGRREMRASGPNAKPLTSSYGSNASSPARKKISPRKAGSNWGSPSGSRASPRKGSSSKVASPRGEGRPDMSARTPGAPSQGLMRCRRALELLMVEVNK